MGTLPFICTSTTDFNSLLNGYMTNGELAKAGEVLDKMERAGVKADVFTFTSLLDGYMKKGELAKAGEVLDKMERAGVKANVVTFNMLLNGYGKKRTMLRKCTEVLDKMLKMGLKPDTRTKNAMLRACKYASDRRAFAQYEKKFSKVLGIPSDTYTPKWAW